MLTFLLVLAVTSAQGEVYTWTDQRGVAHYTNRKDDIPVSFRAGAKALNYDQVQPPGTPALQRNDQPQPPRRPDEVTRKPEERGVDQKDQNRGSR